MMTERLLLLLLLVYSTTFHIYSGECNKSLQNQTLGRLSCRRSRFDGLGNVFVHVIGLAVTVDAHKNRFVSVSESLQVVVVRRDTNFDLKLTD
jgi:hypothetical protein